MKKLIFFAIVLLTYYLAGMYHYLPLLVLCLMELLLVIILFILPRYMRRKLSVNFHKENEAVLKSMETPCNIIVRNTSRFPVSKLELRLRIGYPCQRFRVIRRKPVVKKLYGGSEPGETSLQCSLQVPFCGLVLVELERLRIYDYLSLFSSKKSLNKEMRLAIFPRGRELMVGASFFGWEEQSSQKQTVKQMGDAHHEIRQVREYRPGDPIRHIHWNQSARTDTLWIKEYEKETDSRTHVLVDIRKFREIGTEQRKSAFYELLSALVLGLLRSVAIVQVYWYDSVEKRPDNMEVGALDQCREMLYQLYLEDERRCDVLRSAYGKISFRENAFYNEFMSGGSCFKLDLELRLLFNNELVYQFSQNALDQELSKVILKL